MDQLICASLFHPHYWYEMGMLKQNTGIPSISSSDRWLLGVSVHRVRSKRNIDRKLFQYILVLIAITAVSLVILSAQDHSMVYMYIQYVYIYRYNIPYSIKDWASTSIVVNPVRGQLRTVVILP